MVTETQTAIGHCPTHGTVEASREIPRLRFPYIVYTVRRAVAKRRPFRCSMSAAEVDTDGAL